MKKIIAFGFCAVLFACGAEEKKDDKNVSTKGSAEEKCIELTKQLHGSKEGFKITSSRADKREEVKLALDEKYESNTKFISSVAYTLSGEEKFCTCYINDKNEVLNAAELED